MLCRTPPHKKEGVSFSNSGNVTPTRTSLPLKKKIYIPKAICLLSRNPFYDYFIEILEDLYLASKNRLANTIEAYISNLILTVK